MHDQIERVEVARLRPHPRQAEFFGDLSRPSFELLVEDIRRNGLRHPIEILADATIVCGHQRVRAAKVLGWTEIDAIVLDTIDEAVIERRLIEDNLARRQLGFIAQLRLYEALKREALGRPRSSDPGALRDWLAKLTGVKRCGRTMERWLRILDTPREVQDAVDAGLITRSDALRVLKLSVDDRSRLAAEISAGGDAREVVARFLSRPARNSVERAQEAIRSVTSCLRSTIPILKPHLRTIAGSSRDAEEIAAILGEAIPILERVRQAADKAHDKSRARLDRIVRKIDNLL
jgi:ParB family chromosome partitioning protein